MNPLKLYHRMPPPARSIVASARGAYLKWWRYGPRTEGMVAAALARESWSNSPWQRWQEERLVRILHRAATQVPYYRRHWEERRRRGDRASWEYLENWPVLEKESVRSDPRAFVSDDCDTRRMFHEHTSGTTGKSLDLWWSRETVQIWYALFEARCRRWYGVSRHDQWAILGGQLITPATQRKPPFWVWNGALNQLYMSAYHLAPDLVEHYLDALARYKIRYLWGYTSALNTLAQQALRLGRCDLKLTVAITNAEPLFPYQREAISQAFGCPVRETYGMAEIVAAASECPHGRLHTWPEIGIMQIVNGEEPVPDGVEGELLCTGLLNKDMPLIRYRIGDRARFPQTRQQCECGRTLPLIASIEGRADDLLYTQDGRRVGRLDPIFKAHLPVIEAQVIQETLDCLRVRYVPAPGFTAASGRSIVERLQERMGAVRVVLEEVEQVPREANGKFRAVICKIG
ncbi:MAG: AMP-binding protein [Chloroflexia bacterium]